MHGKKTGRQTEKRVKVMEIEKRKKEWGGRQIFAEMRLLWWKFEVSGSCADQRELWHVRVDSCQTSPGTVYSLILDWQKNLPKYRYFDNTCNVCNFWRAPVPTLFTDQGKIWRATGGPRRHPPRQILSWSVYIIIIVKKDNRLKHLLRPTVATSHN